VVTPVADFFCRGVFAIYHVLVLVFLSLYHSLSFSAAHPPFRLLLEGTRGFGMIPCTSVVQSGRFHYLRCSGLLVIQNGVEAVESVLSVTPRFSFICLGESTNSGRVCRIISNDDTVLTKHIPSTMHDWNCDTILVETPQVSTR
jgi:hypothetical protein